MTELKCKYIKHFLNNIIILKILNIYYAKPIKFHIHQYHFCSKFHLPQIYANIYFSSIPETQNVHNSHIHSDTKDNNTSCTDETEPFNRKQKNPTPIFTPHEEPELSSGEENDALLTKRPFSAVESNQPFRIEISSEHSSSFKEIVQNENNNNPNKSVRETQYPNLTDNDNIESKPTEQDTEYKGQKEPTPPLPSMDGAYSIIKSTMPLSSL